MQAEDGEGKQNKEIGGGVVDMQAVSLLVPAWIFMVSVLDSGGLQGQTIS